MHSRSLRTTDDHSPSAGSCGSSGSSRRARPAVLSPEPPDDVPCLAEASRVGRAHLGPAGISPAELGVNQRSDAGTIDRQVHDLAAYAGAGQLRTAEPGPGQVAGAELRAAEVDALEPGTPEIFTEAMR